MQGKDRVAIAYNNTDITFKALTEAFRDKVLDFYGLKLGRVKSIERADLPQIVVEERKMDFLFLMEDDSYLHLEFQTTVRPDDLERFL